MNAYSFFKYFHSGFRYVVVILILLAIVRSISALLGKKPYTEFDRKVNLFALISAHTQLLLGIVLYFLSPYVIFSGHAMKDAGTRYWTVEHITMMLIAIVLITIGHSKSKKAVLPEAKHRAIAIFYTIAFILVIVTLIVMITVQSDRHLFGISA